MYNSGIHAIAAPLTRNGLEVFFRLEAHGNLANLAHHAKINLVTKLFAPLIASLAGGFQRHLGVDSPGPVSLLLPGETIGEAPILSALGIDQHEHAPAVSQLESLVGSLDFLDHNGRQLSDARTIPSVGISIAGIGYTS